MTAWKTPHPRPPLPRWRWLPPNRVSEPWRPTVYRGYDEWWRPSITVGLPYTGHLTVWRGRPADPCMCCGEPPADPHNLSDDLTGAVWQDYCPDCALTRCDLGRTCLPTS